MKLTLLFLLILVIHTARCQRRGPWRGLRPPPRRLPPCIEERLRSIAPNLPNYRTPEVPNRAEVPIPCPVPNRLEVSKPYKMEAPSTLETIAQLAQNIPKPDVVPTADYYQNVLLSPNLFGIASNQKVPNEIAPNQMLPKQIAPNQIVTKQLVQTEIPRSYQIPMQNVQYFQNLLIPKPQERIAEIVEVPVVEVPRTEKIIVQPHQEKPCLCSSPSVNQFLPAASPLSPWMPSNLPSPSTQSRSHFLRKIPIPPPTL